MALLLFQEDRTVSSKEARQETEPASSTPSVGDPEETRPEASLDTDERTPEEAGYGYGV